MRKIVIGMAMASTALASPAMAREGQWYIQGDGGVMIVEDQNLDVNGVSADAEVDHNTGYDFGAAVGHDFGAFRLEAEASYRSAKVDQIAAGTEGLQIDPVGQPGGRNGLLTGQVAPSLGEANVLSFMLNGIFDFGPDDGLQAFAGGGIGVARVDMDANFDLNGPGAYE
ncbi:MAG: flagellar motor protein MotB, partial [Erythrobacter sp.]|nr:flagellar motor protein MotB [Erythrobacter sp.]